MKRFLVLTAVVLGAVACGGGGQQSTDAPHKPKNARTIVMSDSLLRRGMSDTIRFGHLYSGEIGQLYFWLRNDTPAPIVPVAVKRTCGCTELEYDRRPIKSGEELRFTMRFDARGIRGWQLKVIDLQLSGYEQPLKLFVEADIDWN